MIGLQGIPGVGDIIAYVGVGGDQAFIKKLDTLDARVAQSSKTLNTALNASLIAGVAAFAMSVKAASEFENSFAGVLKTVEGLDDGMGNLTLAGQGLAQGFRDLALAIPISVNELNKIGELGGQLSIPTEDLIQFTETIARLGTSTNLSIEEASMALARFINITQDVAPAGMSVGDQIERIGSVIVELGNNFATTEREIVQFAERIAGAGNVIGLTQDEILALGAALSSVGINAEMGGTAISRIMIDMANSVATGGEKLAKFAEVAGMSVDEFKEAFETDASSAIIAFVEGLGRIQDEGGNTFGTIEDLGFNNVRTTETLLKLAGASNIVVDAFERAAAEYLNNNALIKESDKRYQTLTSQLKLFGNIINDTFIQIGQDFNPGLKATLILFNSHPQAVMNTIRVIADLAIKLGALSLSWKILHGIQVGYLKLSVVPLFVNLATAIRSTTLATTLLSGSTALMYAKFGLLTAAITITYLKWRELLDAYDEGIALFDKVSAGFESTAGIVNKNVEQIVRNIELLGGRGADELVTFRGKIMTVGEASTIMKNLLTGAATKMTAKLYDLAISFDNTTAAEKALTDANITMTQSIVDQILDFDDLIAAAHGDAIALSDISQELEKYNEYAAISSEVSDALKIVQGHLASALGNTSKYARELAAEQKLLNDAGIEAQEPIRIQIAEYEKLLQKYSEGSFQYNKIIEYMGTLYEKLRETSPYTSYQEQLRLTAERIKEASEEAKKQSEEMDKLAYTYGHLYDGTIDLESWLRLMAAAGIETELSTRQMIAANEELLPTLTDSQYEYDSLILVLSDLYEKLGDDNPYKVQAKAIRESRDATKESSIFTRENAIELAQLADQVLNTGGEFGKFVSILFTFAANPVLGVLQLLGIMLSGVSDETEDTIMTMEDLIESLGELGDRIEALEVIFKNLDSALTGSNNLLSETKQKLDEATQALLDLENQTSVNMLELDEFIEAQVRLEYEIEALTQKLEMLTAAFAFDVVMQDAIQYTQWLADEIMRLADYYGDAAFEVQGLIQLIIDQIAANAILFATLQVGSQAYEDMQDAVIQLVIAFIELGGDVGWAEAMLAAFGLTMDDVNAAMTDGSSALTEYEQLLLDLEAAGIRTTDSIQLQIDELWRLAGAVEMGSYEWNQIIAKLQDFYEELGITSQFTEDYMEMLMELVEAGMITGEEMSALIESLSGVADTIEEINPILERNTMLWGLYGDVINTFDWSEFVDQAEMMLAAGIRTEEQVLNEIAAWEDLIGNLEIGSYEYEQVADILADLYDELGLVNPYLDEQDEIIEDNTEALEQNNDLLEHNVDLWNEWGDVFQGMGDWTQFTEFAEMMNAAGIQTEQSIYDQITAWQLLLSHLEAGTYEYEQVIDVINRLASEMGLAVDELGNIIGYTDRIWHEGGAGGDSLLDQILGSLGGDFGTFEENAMKIQQILEQLAYLGTDLGTTDIDEQVGSTIAWLQSLLSTLDPDSQAYADAEAMLQALIDQFLALGGVIPTEGVEPPGPGEGTGGWWEDIIVTWDEVVQHIIDSFNEGGDIMTAIQDASDLISDLLEFNVDLDTTDADEAIQQLIFSMYDYLGTLDPSSPEYAQAMAALQQLLAQYALLGGQAVNNMINAFNSYLYSLDPNSSAYAAALASLINMLSIYTQLGVDISLDILVTLPPYVAQALQLMQRYPAAVQHDFGSFALWYAAYSAYPNYSFWDMQFSHYAPNAMTMPTNLSPEMPETTFSPAAQSAFNQPVESLSEESNRPIVNVLIDEPGPLTSVRITDRQVTPRQNECNRYKITNDLFK